MNNSLGAPFATIAPGIASALWTVEIVGGVSCGVLASLPTAKLGPVNVIASSAKDTIKFACLFRIGLCLFYKLR